MTRLPKFSDLRFASKILLLTSVLGLMAVVITAYALTSLRAIDQQYRSLIALEGQAALTIAETSRHLDRASRLAYTVLTEPDEVRMRASLQSLRATQSRYNAELGQLQKLLPAKGEQMQSITAASQRLFASAERVITAAARWRGDQALQIIHGEFEPVLQLLRADMDSLRDSTIAQFKAVSDELSTRTAQTVLVTALAVGAALVVVIPLSVYVAIAQMSRPLAQLTHTMQRMSQRHYDDAIVLTGRRDEVGQMANALRVFQRSMQREDRLAIELAASAQARRLSEQLVDLTSAIPGAVFQMQVAPDGLRRILFASEKAAHLHGRTIAQLQQAVQPAGREFLHASPQDVQTAHAAFVRSVHTLVPLNFDTQTTHGGHTRWLKTLATARRTPDGGALFNGVWLDVTEQKAQAQALMQAKSLAEKTADDKARFLATMSHEIRTPLNAMLGMTQLALRHAPDAPQRERIEKTLRAGRHLLNIVNDVLDIAKIEAGKMEIAPEDFAPRTWLEEIAELFAPEAQTKALVLHLHVAPTTPERVRGDRQRMSQILINYLNNAVKFTQAGTITVTVDTVDSVEPGDPGTLLRCQVQDTGMGIAEAEQALLFTAFEQGDASITRRFGGTGLGLAISRQLAQLMGGATGVSSVPGTGSTFWFTAGVDAVGSAAIVSPGEEASGATTRHAPSTQLPCADMPFAFGTRVLVVDDNALNRAVAQGLLELGGILVDEACHGAQALAMLEAASDHTYALVLMDMQMPVMDGLTATIALRQNPRFAQLPVIALTANASDADVQRVRAAGMQDHLAKPLLEEALWPCLRHWLPPAPSCAEREVARLDIDLLQELWAGLGDARARAVVAAFQQDGHARVARLQAHAERHNGLDWAAISKEAHDLSGSAGSFGLVRLGALAQQLHACAEQKHLASTHLALAKLLQCARVDLAALAHYMATHKPVREVTAEPVAKPLTTPITKLVAKPVAKPVAVPTSGPERKPRVQHKLEPQGALEKSV